MLTSPWCRALCCEALSMHCSIYVHSGTWGVGHIAVPVHSAAEEMETQRGCASAKWPNCSPERPGPHSKSSQLETQCFPVRSITTSSPCVLGAPSSPAWWWVQPTLKSLTFLNTNEYQGLNWGSRVCEARGGTTGWKYFIKYFILFYKMFFNIWRKVVIKNNVLFSRTSKCHHASQILPFAIGDENQDDWLNFVSFLVHYLTLVRATSV